VLTLEQRWGGASCSTARTTSSSASRSPRQPPVRLAGADEVFEGVYRCGHQEQLYIENKA